MRASSTVKRQFTRVADRLRSFAHAFTSRRSVSMSAKRRPRHCLTKTESSISSMFSHEPCTKHKPPRAKVSRAIAQRSRGSGDRLAVRTLMDSLPKLVEKRRFSEILTHYLLEKCQKYVNWVMRRGVRCAYCCT